MDDWLRQLFSDAEAIARVRIAAKIEAARHNGFEEAAAQNRYQIAELTRLLREAELMNQALRGQLNMLKLPPPDVNGEP